MLFGTFGNHVVIEQYRLDLVVLLAHIADTGNLSVAAREAGVSQPSASRLLKQLEELVGARLVERSSRRVGLTTAGKRFLDATRTLVSIWEGAVEDLRSDREDLAGHLRIVMPVIAGQELLAPIVARFIRQNPGVTVECLLRDEAVDPTRDADLWIRVGDLPTDGLIVRELWHIECALVGCIDHPAADHPEQLTSCSAVRVTTYVPETVELAHRDGERFILRQLPGFLTDNIFAARGAILEGVGYGVLPLWTVQASFRNGTAMRLCPDWRAPVFTLSLAYPPRQHRPKRLVALLAFIKAELIHARRLGIAFSEAEGLIRTASNLSTDCPN